MTRCAVCGELCNADDDGIEYDGLCVDNNVYLTISVHHSCMHYIIEDWLRFKLVRKVKVD